jgi:hypothetical protein
MKFALTYNANTAMACALFLFALLHQCAFSMIMSGVTLYCYSALQQLLLLHVVAVHTSTQRVVEAAHKHMLLHIILCLALDVCAT